MPHLTPALFAERIVYLTSVAAATLRLPVTQEVDNSRHFGNQSDQSDQAEKEGDD